MNTLHFFAVSVAAILGGCQICTDCEPVDYVLDSSDSFYEDSFSVDGESVVFTEDEGWTEGEVWTEDSVPILDTIPIYTGSSSSYSYYPSGTVSTQTYSPWRSFGRQLPYSGPRFSTPPMQSMPYPTETYYPFKRPSAGTYVPWGTSTRSTYYPTYSVPSYDPTLYYYE